jgi:hypothetical protein
MFRQACSEAQQSVKCVVRTSRDTCQDRQAYILRHEVSPLPHNYLGTEHHQWRVNGARTRQTIYLSQASHLKYLVPPDCHNTAWLNHLYKKSKEHP